MKNFIKSLVREELLDKEKIRENVVGQQTPTLLRKEDGGTTADGFLVRKRYVLTAIAACLLLAIALPFALPLFFIDAPPAQEPVEPWDSPQYYITAISAQHNSALALRNDGTVWRWWNSPDSDQPPQQLRGFYDIIAIGQPSPRAIYALRSDGTVWYRENIAVHPTNANENEDLLNPLPVQVPELSNIAAIAAGGDHLLALRDDGTVWAWGQNGYGQLGSGTTGTRRHITKENWQPPVQVLHLNNVTAVAASGDHSMALDADGKVWTWGVQADGVSTTQFDVFDEPVQVPELYSVVSIASSSRHAAILSDGTTWEWGFHSSQGVSLSLFRSQRTPVQFGLDNIIAIVPELLSTTALRDDGTVWSMDRHQNGLDDTPIILQIPNLDNIVAISDCLALRKDGTVWGWSTTSSPPIRVIFPWETATPAPPGHYIAAVSAGSTHNLAIDHNGNVWEWRNDGTTPVQIQGLNNIVDVGTGTEYNMAIRQDGAIFIWGARQPEPIQLPDLPDASIVGNDFITPSIVDSNGRLRFFVRDVNRAGREFYRWEYNDIFNLSGIVAYGFGAISTNTTPVHTFNIWLRDDGTIWEHIMPAPSLVASSYLGRPERIHGIDNAADMTIAGDGSVVILRSDGTVWVRVDGRFIELPGIGDAAALSSYFILNADGTVWAWPMLAGLSSNSTLSDLAFAFRPAYENPTLYELTNITAISASNAHLLALRDDGSVWQWSPSSGAPIQVVFPWEMADKPEAVDSEPPAAEDNPVDSQPLATQTLADLDRKRTVEELEIGALISAAQILRQDLLWPRRLSRQIYRGADGEWITVDVGHAPPADSEWRTPFIISYARINPNSGFRSIADVRGELLRYYEPNFLDALFFTWDDIPLLIERDGYLYTLLIESCEANYTVFWDSAVHAIVEQDDRRTVVESWAPMIDGGIPYFVFSRFTVENGLIVSHENLRSPTNGTIFASCFGDHWGCVNHGGGILASLDGTLFDAYLGEDAVERFLAYDFARDRPLRHEFPVLVRMIQYFNISHATFTEMATQHNARLVELRAEWRDPPPERHELLNADIIFTFNAAIIGEYYCSPWARAHLLVQAQSDISSDWAAREELAGELLPQIISDHTERQNELHRQALEMLPR
ncbi:MAG: hypothetical protein FWE06_00395 [Oscillospiraceae bacterium]|nr:hypothetical protein [Oscillospiraceae bacterium]